MTQQYPHWKVVRGCPKPRIHLLAEGALLEHVPEFYLQLEARLGDGLQAALDLAAEVYPGTHDWAVVFENVAPIACDRPWSTTIPFVRAATTGRSATPGADADQFQTHDSCS